VWVAWYHTTVLVFTDFVLILPSFVSYQARGVSERNRLCVCVCVGGGGGPVKKKEWLVH
jgi:hypothetical protein